MAVWLAGCLLFVQPASNLPHNCYLLSSAQQKYNGAALPLHDLLSLPQQRFPSVASDVRLGLVKISLILLEFYSSWSC